MRRIFNEYTNPETQKDYRDNLKVIVKHVWDLVGDEVKSDIGQKLLQLKLEDKVDMSLYANDFIIKVKGIKYVPSSVRKHMFIKKAKEFLVAHDGYNNFYTEVPHAVELEELGYDVPDDALEIYVKAIIFSYAGNSYGYSHDASPNNKRMIENLSTKGVEQLLNSLSNNKEYAWHFTSNAPINRLKEVLEMLRGKSNLLPKHKTAIEKILKVKLLRKYFMDMTE